MERHEIITKLDGIARYLDGAMSGTAADTRRCITALENLPLLASDWLPASGGLVRRRIVLRLVEGDQYVTHEEVAENGRTSYSQGNYTPCMAEACRDFLERRRNHR